MEKYLNILDEDPNNDKITKEDALRVLPNIKDSSQCIITELKMLYKVNSTKQIVQTNNNKS